MNLFESKNCKVGDLRLLNNIQLQINIKTNKIIFFNAETDGGVSSVCKTPDTVQFPHIFPSHLRTSARQTARPISGQRILEKVILKKGVSLPSSSDFRKIFWSKLEKTLQRCIYTFELIAFSFMIIYRILYCQPLKTNLQKYWSVITAFFTLPITHIFVLIHFYTLLINAEKNRPCKLLPWSLR